MYLPQFHRTKENDEWWGEGFTDWVSAKNAKPLFDGHNQPHIPLNNNYYNLLDKKTMQWQAELAKKYSLHGFCFYHYWFKDGRMILEKPAENLLKWKDVDINFCFSWDSNAWANTWSRVNFAYSWTSQQEKSDERKNGSEFLIEQNFGRTDYWKKHFDYLLPFFLDNRYIKISNKPVFLFYAAQNVYCLDDMLEFWEKLAKQHGLDGIYSIVTNENEKNWDNVCASLKQSPGYIMPEMVLRKENIFINRVQTFDYTKLCELSLCANFDDYDKAYFGATVGYDDTPRRTNGSIILGVTPQNYEKNLIQAMCKNHHYGNEFQFINAWNEWGEGMHLEPDTVNGYAYLEATKNALERFEQSDKLWINSNPIALETKLNASLQKMSEYFSLMNQWMYSLEDEKPIASYFLKNNFRKIAIYGYGHFAKHLLFQLADSGIKVEYIIDKAKKQNSIPYLAKTLQDALEEVDAVIVTPFMEYKQIKKALTKKLNSPIISIKEVVMEL